MAEAWSAPTSDYVFSITFSQTISEDNRKCISSFLDTDKTSPFIVLKRLKQRLKKPCFADVLHRVIAFELRDLTLSDSPTDLPDRLSEALRAKWPQLPTFEINMIAPCVITSDPGYHLAIDPKNEWIALFPRPYNGKKDSAQGYPFLFTLPTDLISIGTPKEIRKALKQPIRAALARDAHTVFDVDIAIAGTENSLFLCILFKAGRPENYMIILKNPNYSLTIPILGKTISIGPVVPEQKEDAIVVFDSEISIKFSSLQFYFKRDYQETGGYLRQKALETNILLPEVVDAMSWPDGTHATLTEQILYNVQWYLMDLDPNKANWLDLCPRVFTSEVVDDINFYAPTVFRHGDLHDVLITVVSGRVPHSAPIDPYGDPLLLKSLRSICPMLPMLNVDVDSPTVKKPSSNRYTVDQQRLSAAMSTSYGLLAEAFGSDFDPSQYLYHATSAPSRVLGPSLYELLSQPINFRINYRQPRDFGFGFYLARSLEHAAAYFLDHWPQNGMAIVVYKKPNWNDDDDVRVVNSEAEWKEIVTAGHQRPFSLNDATVTPRYVWFGPMCFNVNAVRDGTQTPKPRFYGRDVVHQFCVKGNSPSDPSKNLTAPVAVLIFRHPKAVALPHFTSADFPPLS